MNKHIIRDQMQVKKKYMEKYSLSCLMKICEGSFTQHCEVGSYPVSKGEPWRSVRKEMACSEWRINWRRATLQQNKIKQKPIWEAVVKIQINDKDDMD